MTDIVERLREEAGCHPEAHAPAPVLNEAAEEIERLRAALTEMRDRDDRNGSLPAAYREIIDRVLEQ